MNVEKKQPELDDRMKRAVERHQLLEKRLHNLRRLPGIYKKPLTRAEREFKSELGMDLIHCFSHASFLVHKCNPPLPYFYYINIFSFQLLHIIDSIFL